MGADRLTPPPRVFRSVLYPLPFFAIFALLAFSACAPAAPPPTVTPTPTSTLTPSPTATIVWFPPTNTPTPFATSAVTATLTPDMLPPHGSEIFTEDFSSETGWSLTQTSAGKIVVGYNRLNIAIDQPRILLSTLRDQPEFSDFYLEVTVRTNLCRSTDEFGLILRAASASDFLRYSLSCDGQVRLDKLTDSQASSPHPWSLSGSVPRGAPAEIHLAVWASGSDLRFFINGQYQFSVNEPVLLSGKIGFFARSFADSPVSVSFSDLVVYAP